MLIPYFERQMLQQSSATRSSGNSKSGFSNQNSVDLLAPHFFRALILVGGR